MYITMRELYEKRSEYLENLNLNAEIYFGSFEDRYKYNGANMKDLAHEALDDDFRPAGLFVWNATKDTFYSDANIRTRPIHHRSCLISIPDGID